MPRKEPYKKKKIPFVEVYPKLDYDDTYEALKKEAAKQVNELIGWKTDQFENNPENAIDMYIELGYPNLVDRAKRYLDNIYTRNRTIPEAQFKAEQARMVGDQEEFDKWTEKALTLEDEVTGLAFRIYKIYCHLKSRIIVRTKRQIQGLDDDPSVSIDLVDEYEQDNDDLDRMGGV